MSARLLAVIPRGPALLGHGLIIPSWRRWHVAPRGSGLDPFSLRPCLPYALALPAAACSGFRVQGRPQEGAGRCAGRSGRSGGPGTGPVSRLGGRLPRLTWAVGAGVGARGSRAFPPPSRAPDWLWGGGPGRHRWRVQGLHRPGQMTSVRAISSATPSGKVPLECVIHAPTHLQKQKRHTTTRPVRVRVGVHACGRACARACAPRRAACGRVCNGSALLDFPLPPLWSCLCRGNFAPQRLQSRSPLTVQDDGCQVVPQCSKPLPAG